MRKITDLRAEEFKDINPEEFAQWKILRLKAEKTMIFILLGILAVIGFVMIVWDASGFLIAFLVILTPIISKYFAYDKSNQYAKKIGLEENNIREALKK